jgi:hypothetical protein
MRLQPGGTMDCEAALKRTAFGTAFEQLRSVGKALLRQRKPGGTDPHLSFKVLFKGEYVEGEGGPYRQFFTDVSKELQGQLPLLVPCPNAQAKIGENRDKFVFAPGRDSALDMAMYEFLGVLMGCALRTGGTLPASLSLSLSLSLRLSFLALSHSVLLTLDLPSFVWKPLVGLPPEREDLYKARHTYTNAFSPPSRLSALDLMIIRH